MTTEPLCPPANPPEKELGKLILRMSHQPEGVIALHKKGKQEQTFEFLERGLKAEAVRVIKVDILEVLVKFQHAGHLFGNFLSSLIERPDWQENTAFLFCIPENLTREQAVLLLGNLDFFCGRDGFEEQILQNHKVYPIFLLSDNARKDIRSSNSFGNIREPTICDFTGL